MGPSVLTAQCPECHSEIVVDLEASHRSFGDNEKMLYRLVCESCGLSYDVHFEDLHLSDKA
jgi:transcription elongation factor Elf1